MTEWKTLTGKFTAEEIEVIKNFQKMIGENDNQLVRKSVELMMFFMLVVVKMSETGVDKELEREYRQIRKEIAKYPELKARLDPFIEKTKKNYMDSIKKIVKIYEPDMNKFTEERKRGPIPTQNPRGRPVDKGN